MENNQEAGNVRKAEDFQEKGENNKKDLVDIFVNSTPEQVSKGEITYNEVVTLAFPDFPQHPERSYSVKYKKGVAEKPEGILAPGSEVKVHEKMRFDVTFTGQS
jgi:hypothetical protein